MQNTSTINREYKLWVLLHQVRDIILEAREKGLRKYGITAQQAQILVVIHAIGDEATPAQIARWTLRRPHSISGILQRMEKIGLVKKDSDLPRKNQVRITLTELGQQAYKRAIEADAISRIISSLSEEKYQQLKSCLEILREKGIEEIGLDADTIPSPESL